MDLLLLQGYLVLLHSDFIIFQMYMLHLLAEGELYHMEQLI